MGLGSHAGVALAAALPWLACQDGDSGRGESSRVALGGSVRWCSRLLNTGVGESFVPKIGT